MQEEGIRPDQISQVRGFADQRLRVQDKPEDPSNRRISLIVQYISQSGSVMAPTSAELHSKIVAIPQ
jgi:chemotaxis protein MotB